MTNKTPKELQGKIRALEEELSELKRKVEDIYTPLIELTNEAFFLVDREGAYLFVTGNMAISYNTPLHEIIGKKYGDFHKPEVTRVFEERVAEVFATGRVVADEHKDRFDNKYIYRTFHPIKTTQGEVIKVAVIGQDITERKKMETALKESEEGYRALVKSTGNALYTLDRECRYDFITDNLATRHKASANGVIGKKYSDFHSPEQSRIVAEKVAEVFARGVSVQDEHLGSQGNYVLRYFYPIKTQVPDGEVIMVGVLSQDITERKQMEEALQKSEKAARRLAQENELLAEIGRIISSTLDIEEVYGRFAEKVREAIPFDRIAVNTVNMKDFTRTIRYVKGNRFSGDRIGEVLSLAGTGTEQAVRTKSSLLINSKNREDMIRKFSGITSLQLGSQATMIIPLISKDVVIGTLAVHSVKTDAYSENDLLLAERVGSQISGAIANAQLFLDRKRAEEALRSSDEEARRLAKENKVMAEIGRIIGLSLNIDEVYERFAEEVRKLISIDRITVNIVDPGDDTAATAYISGTELPHRKKGAIYPLAFTVTDELRRTRRSVLINEENYQDYVERFPDLAIGLQAGLQSLMATPLISKDEVIGVLQFRSARLNTYSEKDLELAERVGSQIAGAIANAQLFLERQRAEEALKESEAKYYDLYENAPDMYYSLDVKTGTIKECNGTFVRTTGYTKDDLIGKPIFELFDAGSVDDAKKAFQQFPVTGEVRDAERRVKCKDGRIIDVSLNVSAIRDKDGNITHSRSVWHDITERMKYAEIIHNLSITDQMTGIYNRRGFITLAEQQLRVAERTKNGLLLLYTDLDGLKQINDNLGHKAGDEALIEAANVLKEAFRKMDIIARVGGDEFAILAPEVSMEYSDMAKNRLQDQLDRHNAWTGRTFNISISVGMAYYDPENPCSLDELISRADTLMYKQKSNKEKVPGLDM